MHLIDFKISYMISASVGPLGELYVYEPRVYCTFTREFTSGHGLMCTAMVTLGSRYSLQCFVSCFDILVHLDSSKFYSQPATCIRRAKFLLNLPSWWFANAIFLLICQSFTPPTFRTIQYLWTLATLHSACSLVVTFILNSQIYCICSLFDSDFN